jgi:hypothetical protein
MEVQRRNEIRDLPELPKQNQHTTSMTGEENRHVPQSLYVDAFHYVVWREKTYRVEQNVEGDTLLVQVDEIPEEHWQRWEDDE